MAWTTPRTWTDTELVTAAIMNPHVRDNFNAIGPIVRVRKTSDQTVSASVTLVDDTALTFAIAASEVWAVQIMVRVNAPAAGGFKRQITGPAGATGLWNELHIPDAATPDFNSLAVGSPQGNTIAYTDAPYSINATVVNAGTAGTCRLQWAQNAASGSTVVRADSHLLAWRIA